MKTKGPWSDRITLLVQACGWTQKQAAQKFGFGEYGAVKRIIYGGRPRTSFLLTLANLEKVYAGEIEAFKAGTTGIVPGTKWARWDFRAKNQSGRPADLAEVGQVGTLDSRWAKYTHGEI